MSGWDDTDRAREGVLAQDILWRPTCMISIPPGGPLHGVPGFHDMKSGADILNEGEACHVKGTILGFKRILCDGKVVSLPQIFCLETQ